MSGHRDDSQKTAADSAAAQNQSQGATNFANQQTLYKNLWGSAGSGGALSGFLNPANLNVTAPTGPQQLQYNAAVQNTANQFKGARGALSRYMASRGFGANSPSGFGASNAASLARDEADAQGQNFTNYTNASYNNALNNFWNAANVAAGQGATMGSQAVNATGNAGDVYGNLYANSYVQSPWAIAANAAGTIGGAALGNPALMQKI